MIAATSLHRLFVSGAIAAEYTSSRTALQSDKLPVMFNGSERKGAYEQLKESMCREANPQRSA